MTIYAKILLTTASTLLLVSAPSNNESPPEAQKTHDVEKLIYITKRDIRDLEVKIDSILVSKGDSLMIKKLNNGTINTR